jgi:protein TonB
MPAVLAGNELQLPWESSGLEDRRFQSILGALLLVLLALGIVLPLMHVPELERQVQEALPPQLAQIVLKEKALPKPPPVVSKPVEKKPEPEKIIDKPEPVVKPEAKPVPRSRVASAPKPAVKVQQAREKAAVSGLLQFQDDLAQMRDQVDMAKLNRANLSQGQASAVEVDRSVITRHSTTTSSGINTAALSRETGGGALSARQTTRVESNLAAVTESAKRAQPKAGTRSNRSDEDIRKVMDRNKGAIFAIYNRALRKDPMLSGKMTVQLVIEPSGQVSAIKILGSELGDGSLERKLLSRIRMIVFGARSTASTTLNYSFDFLPS